MCYESDFMIISIDICTPLDQKSMCIYHERRLFDFSSYSIPIASMAIKICVN